MHRAFLIEGASQQTPQYKETAFTLSRRKIYFIGLNKQIAYKIIWTSMCNTSILISHIAGVNL